MLINTPTLLHALPNQLTAATNLCSSTLLPKRAQPPSSLSLGQQDQRFHHKMASVESIGACSLDFDASAADLCGKDLTASECTLHSNGDLDMEMRLLDVDCYGGI